MTNSDYDKNNIFAKILRKEAKAEVVFEDEYILCFKDIFPKAPIHILIIPKASFKDISDFSKNASTEQKNAIFKGIEYIIKNFKLSPAGCRIITNFGVHGRQEVNHLHFHLLGGQDVGPMLTKF
jgi:diadenosine tetraphosphate (Ap4A) HIT family hydrolase